MDAVRSCVLRQGLALAASLMIVVAVAGIFAATLWVARQEEQQGQVHFSVSCSLASQRQFDFATSRLHSLRFNESERIYNAIAAAEPDCAMAYWGIAMSRIKRPVPGLRLPDDIRTGQEALRSAAAARTATPRERGYIAALTLLFDEQDAAQWDDRTIAYEQAMARLSAGNPDDDEAGIFYALALNMVPRARDRSFSLQTKATELLLLALARHPGLAHYLTYCLRSPDEEVPAAAVTPQDRFVSSIQSALATLTLVGVGMFFVAIWPAWSPLRSPGRGLNS
jgi:hypothetical protein